MKESGWFAILGMVVLLTAGGCRTHAGWRDVRLFDEEGNVEDFFLPPLDFHRNSTEYMLGRVIAECRDRVTNRAVRISLLSRDCRAIPEPVPGVVSGEELLSIYERPSDPRAAGKWSLQFPVTRLSAVLSVLAVSAGKG